MSVDQMIQAGIITHEDDYHEALHYITTLQKLTLAYQLSKIEPDRLARMRTMAIKIYGNQKDADQWILAQQAAHNTPKLNDCNPTSDSAIELMIKAMGEPEKNHFI